MSCVMHRRDNARACESELLLPNLDSKVPPGRLHNAEAAEALRSSAESLADLFSFEGRCGTTTRLHMTNFACCKGVGWLNYSESGLLT